MSEISTVSRSSGRVVVGAKPIWVYYAFSPFRFSDLDSLRDDVMRLSRQRLETVERHLRVEEEEMVEEEQVRRFEHKSRCKLINSGEPRNL
jgi:hypothetical protein